MAKFLYREEQLTYDDVLLYPQKSLDSRNEVVLSYNPIIPAPMSTVSEEALCLAQLNAGGIAILHRYVSLERKINFYNKVVLSENTIKSPDIYDRCFIGVGLEKDEIDKLCQAGINNFCIDIANGWSDKCIDLIKYLKDKVCAKIIAGNIATPEGFVELKNVGADYIRVGIGGGSLCTTRIVSGHGFPNFSCITEIHKEPNRHGTKLIADGGIRNSGDCVKALAAGADYCMMGKYFANCEEAPGDIVEKDGKKYKVYAGMASSYVQEKVYGKVIAAPEGVSTLVPLGRPYLETLELLLKGIKSGCSYSNARSIDELRRNAYFIRVSPATLEENKPHGQLLKFEV